MRCSAIIVPQTLAYHVNFQYMHKLPGTTNVFLILYFYFETEMAENSCSIQIRFDRERNSFERKRASPLFELENWTTERQMSYIT